MSIQIAQVFRPLDGEDLAPIIFLDNWSGRGVPSLWLRGCSCTKLGTTFGSHSIHMKFEQYTFDVFGRFVIVRRSGDG